MSYKYKLASNLVPFSRVSDRFVSSGYHEGYELSKKLEMAAAIDGITGAAGYWPADVERDVREHMEVLKPGGRWVAGSSHSIVNYIPYENFVAMINAFHKFGIY